MNQKIKYPFYTYNGCFWKKFLTPYAGLQVCDSYQAVGIEIQDYTPHATFDRQWDDKDVTAKEFQAAMKRTTERIKLRAAGKSDKHLWPTF